jgi:hypothetical protein
MAAALDWHLQTQDAPVTGSRVIALPTFNTEQRIDAVAPLGASIGEIVEYALPEATPEIFQWVRVSIGNDIIPREMWEIVRPKPHAIVIVRVLPGNGGTLRSVLSISVAVAAMALGQFYAAPALLTAGFSPFAANAIGAAVTATTLLAGTFLVNSLVPIRQDKSATAGLLDSPTYSAQGFRNVANPDGVVPCVLGKVRFAPPYAALPYTEIINGETHVRAIFLVGYGPVNITNIRIGDTPIDKLKDVEYEVRQGYASDAPLTIYTKQTLEERFSIQLSQTDGGQSRFTASDVSSAQIDILFPSGLFWMVTNRAFNPPQTYPTAFNVVIRVSYRLETSSTWTVVTDWNIWGATQKAFSASYEITFPTRGRYEVKLERLTADLDDLNGFNQDNQFVTISVWSSIKNYRPEYPLNFNKPLALIAVKVRASKQLNGILDNLNCEASRICKDWDAATSSWVTRETQNPASLFRYAVQGPAAAYPLTDNEIDLSQLQDWHAYCASKGLKYNRVHDFESSIYDVMGDVCAAGRASPRDDGTKWGVVVDQKQTVTIAHMTPRNAWDFSGERPYVIFPHAFRVKFYDETNSFKQAERVIPWPGFVGTPTITESIDLPGVTSPDQVWLEARKRQYELIYRRDVFNIMQDFEGAIARRGDMVRLSYDVLNSTQVSARVKAVSGSSVTIDDFVTMESGKTYALRIRKLATSELGNDLSILRTVKTAPGQTKTIILTGSGTAPEAGDLVMFGEASKETIECVVREAEGAEEFNRRFTLIPHAPEIFDLLDAETPPAWNGRVGAEIYTQITAFDFSSAENSQYINIGWF